jgi:hypothetical protein
MSMQSRRRRRVAELFDVKEAQRLLLDYSVAELLAAQEHHAALVNALLNVCPQLNRAEALASVLALLAARKPSAGDKVVRRAASARRT